MTTTNHLDVLLGKVEDPVLRAQLQREVERLRDDRQFGLVFERHLPETVRLYTRPVRRGSTVQVIDEQDGPTWWVKSKSKDKVTLERTEDGETFTEVRAPDELVVVAEFGQAIYPGFQSVGSVERGGDKPFHTVINGENYHAIEALLYAYEGQVDCIYIDPPYNTGARDWKYNNDYVEAEDTYRHSKWLSFMEKRLKVAKRLLNPADSVLIVTIDEKEMHRLRLLMEAIFPGVSIQVVTIVIQNAGSNRQSELGRVEEYALFAFFGNATPVAVSDDLLNPAPSTRPEKVRWESLLRSGTGSNRADSPQLFFPVFIDHQDGRLVGCGDAKPVDVPRSAWNVPDGCFAVWPTKKNGTDGRWRCSPDTLRGLLEQGFAYAGACDSVTGKGTIWYLGRSARKKIDTGEFQMTGVDDKGAAVVGVVDAGQKTYPAKTVWNRQRHHAGWHGTNLLTAFVPSRSFPFPKSLYAVEDALRIAVGDNPDALVVDFFAGSGTTAHAVMRLNRQDGGRRRSIAVTNNEVSDKEARALAKAGHRPGDSEWETLGIFEYITRPRLEAAVTGLTHTGAPVAGDYKFTDEFPMAEGFEENVEFLNLTYEDPSAVSLGRAFEAIAPLLWLKAGATGPRIDKIPTKAWALPKGATYGVLFKPGQWRGFLDAVAKRDDVRHVFVVTDSEAVFQQVVAEVPAGIEATMLYEDYLSTFAVNRAGEG